MSDTRTELRELLTIAPPTERLLEVFQVRVSPMLAQQLLVFDKNIRTPHWPTVLRYSTDMSAGKWSYTGEPLIYDEDGWGRNGKQRLAACVESGVSFDTLIVIGVDPRSMLDMDTGRHRSLGTYLAFSGYSDSKSLAASIKTSYQLLELQSLRHEKISNETLLDWFRNGHESLVEDLSVVHKWEKQVPKGFTRKHMASIRHAAGFVQHIDIADIDSFFSQLAFAEDTIQRRSPAFQLRRYLARETTSAQDKDRLQDPDRIGVTIKAINAYLRGDEVGNIAPLLWKRGGRDAEPFPRLEADPFAVVAATDA